MLCKQLYNVKCQTTTPWEGVKNPTILVMNPLKGTSLLQHLSNRRKKTLKFDDIKHHVSTDYETGAVVHKYELILSEPLSNVKGDFIRRNPITHSNEIPNALESETTSIFLWEETFADHADDFTVTPTATGELEGVYEGELRFDISLSSGNVYLTDKELDSKSKTKRNAESNNRYSKLFGKKGDS